VSLKRLVIAVTAVAALTGTTPAYADQTVTGSLGTVQVQPPAVDVGAGASAPTTVDPTGTSSSNPTATVSAATQPSSGGSQTAQSSVGTAQLGSGPQSAGNSVGTVQAQPPATAAKAAAKAPTTASVADGVTSNPNAAVSASATPSSGGSQSASNSIGTAQVGGGGSQTATGSAGTVQAALPGVNADGSLTSPTSVGIGSGLTADPALTTSAALMPATGGTQTADSSIGTAQVGGGGSQSASNSAGTVQAAMPAATATGGAGPGPSVAVDATVQPATGGSQSAENSIGTVQLGGGGPTTAPTPTGTSTTPAGGPGSGTFFSTAGSPLAATTPTAVAATGAPATALPVSTQAIQPIRQQALGVRTPITPGSPVTMVRRLAGLPFTGLALWFVLFAGLMLVASGLTTRKATELA
jgi:hypothetical protein